MGVPLCETLSAELTRAHRGALIWARQLWARPGRGVGDKIARKGQLRWSGTTWMFRVLTFGIEVGPTRAPPLSPPPWSPPRGNPRPSFAGRRSFAMSALSVIF